MTPGAGCAQLCPPGRGWHRLCTSSAAKLITGTVLSTPLAPRSTLGVLSIPKGILWNPNPASSLGQARGGAQNLLQPHRTSCSLTRSCLGWWKSLSEYRDFCLVQSLQSVATLPGASREFLGTRADLTAPLSRRDCRNLAAAAACDLNNPC